MTRSLPSLKQLRAFEAAARLGSFKDAADELHVTHAAISHQVKALEEDLGQPLFHRLTRRVELMPEAGELAAQLTRSFAQIADAVDTVRQAKGGGALKISSVPAFGYRFVLPRIPDFRATHPQIDIEVSLQAGIVELEGGQTDAAIRYGEGSWPGLEARLIARDYSVPVCAASLAAGKDLPLLPSEIAQMPYALSPGAEQDWRVWCRKQALDNPPRPAPVDLENRAMVLDFLLTGGGVALMDLLFASRELQNGQLVILHPDVIDGVNGVYLVWPKTPVPDPKIKAFGDWLVQEVEALDISATQPRVDE